MKRALLLAALLLAALGTRPVDADTTCIGVGCGGAAFSTVSPTFTGTVTLDRLRAVGTAPASCAATGNGAGSCAVVAGSTDSAGLLSITTAAAGTAATGMVTLTFAAAQGAVLPVCMGMLQGDPNGQNWSATASTRGTQTSTTSACVWAWDNTVALAVSETYLFAYIVVSR